MAFRMSGFCTWRQFAPFATLAMVACASTPATRLQDASRMQQEAAQAYVSGNYGTALSDYRQLTQMVPENADAWFRLGNVYSRIGQLDNAVAAYEKTLQYSPRHADRKSVV